MTDFSDIPLPAPEERERAVAAIVAAGVPARAGLAESLRAVPLRALFFGVEDCSFAAVLLSLLCLLPGAAAAARQTILVPLLFLLSPALYAAFALLSAWKERMTGTLEWKRTCRLNFRALTALRMLCFGGLSAALCVTQCVLIWLFSGRRGSLLWMMGLSFSSLFLYAVLALALRRLSRRLAVAAAPAIWAGMGWLLLACPAAAALLLRVPAAVFFLVALGASLAGLAEVRSYINKPMEGGFTHYAYR